MTSNKFKAAGYKITVKPCKASPPVFVWPPVQVLAHLQASAKKTPAEPEPPVNIEINAIFKCEKETPPSQIVYVHEIGPETKPVRIEIHCHLINSQILAYVEFAGLPWSLEIATDWHPWTQGKSALYLFEDWPLVDPHGLHSARLWVMI